MSHGSRKKKSRNSIRGLNATAMSGSQMVNVLSSQLNYERKDEDGLTGSLLTTDEPAVA
jgi:hypothetical protein